MHRGEAVALLQGSAELHAQVAVHHAKVVAFLARTGARNVHAAAAAAAAPTPDADGDDSGGIATEGEQAEEEDDDDDGDCYDDDGDDALVNKR